MEITQNGAAAPIAGWYPDPAGSAMLRYWDGAAWTEHLAPRATPTAPPQPFAGHAPAPVYQQLPPRPPRPPHERIWTRGTIAMLVVCALLVIASVPVVSLLSSAKARALEGDAAAVVEGFLSKTTTGDPSWREFASADLQPAADTYTPIYGDLASARQLDLSVSYTFDEADFEYSGAEDAYGSEDPRSADTVAVPVKLTYSFSVDGETFTSDFAQAVWLTRPYYYGKSDKPSASDPTRKPSRVGPWQVVGLAAPWTVDFDFESEGFTTTFADEAIESDDDVCTEPKSMILEMSEDSRQDGSLRSSCLFHQGEAKLSPQDLDPKAVARDFPVMNEFSTIPTDIMGTEPEAGLLPPLSQYPITMGDTEYVFTIAATSPDETALWPQTLRFIQVAEVTAE